MPLTQDQKDSIVAMSDQGLDERAIAANLGIRVIGVYGTLKAHRVRLGLEPDPLAGKRGRKKKVRVKTEEVFETEDGEEVGVLPDSTAAPDAGFVSSTSPLFPRGTKQSATIDRIVVERLIAKPMSAGVGVLGYLDASADEMTIKQAFGGGRYHMKALNSSGALLGTKTVTIAGESLRDGEDETLAASWQDPNQSAIAAQIASQNDQIKMLTAQLLTMGERQSADQMRRMEEESRREREAYNERQRQNELFFDRISKETQASHERSLQFVMSAQKQPVSSLKDKLEEIQLLRDVMGDGGGEGAGLKSIVAAAAPALLEILARMKGIPVGVPGPMPQLPAQTQPVPAQQAQAPNAGEEEDDPPMDLDELGDEIEYSLAAYGVPEKDAANLAAQLKGYGAQIVQNYQKAAPQTPRANGNGKQAAKAPEPTPPPAPEVPAPTESEDA